MFPQGLENIAMMGKQLDYFDYENVDSFFSSHHYVNINSSCYSSVFLLNNRNTIFNQSARVFSKAVFQKCLVYVCYGNKSRKKKVKVGYAYQPSERRKAQ